MHNAVLSKGSPLLFALLLTLPVTGISFAQEPLRLDQSDSIRGVDANANGVRDDVELHISRAYQAKQKAAAMQYAAALQSALISDKTDPLSVRRHGTRSLRGMQCLIEVFGSENKALNRDAEITSEEIIALTTNTGQRLMAYLSFGRAVNGSVLALPEGGSCD